MNINAADTEEDVDWTLVKERRDAYVKACNEFQEADDVYNKAQIVRQVAHRKMQDLMASINEAMLPEFNKKKKEEPKGSEAAEKLKRKLFGENPTDD